MDSFFSRYRNALVLITVLLAQVIGLAVQVRRPGQRPEDKGGVLLIRAWVTGIVTPPERLLHDVGRSVRGTWMNYVDLIHVRKQNESLQAQLDRLRLEQASLAEDARQGQRLQALLGFQEKYIYKTVAAQVIGSSGTEQSQVLLIDKGSRDGIRPDMPVITPDGIVGKTRDVFGHTSQVLEISDPTSGAGVILANTRIRGVLRGNSWGQPQIVNVSPDERIKAGEPAVTSGGDAIFPRGLPVGAVDRVAPEPDGTLVNVLIRPAANLSRLEEVLIITSTGNKMPAPMQQDLSDAQQKASDILAERLPSRADPNAPAAAQEDDETVGPDGEVARPMRPPQVVHADRYTPSDTPPASELTPGQRFAEGSTAGGAASGGGQATHESAAPGAGSAAGKKPATSTGNQSPRNGGNAAGSEAARPGTSQPTHPGTASEGSSQPGHQQPETRPERRPNPTSETPGTPAAPGPGSQPQGDA